MTGEFSSKPKSRCEKTYPNTMFGRPDEKGVCGKVVANTGPQIKVLKAHIFKRKNGREMYQKVQQ